MGTKTVRVNFDEIKDPALIRGILEKRLKERNLDLHRNDVKEFHDDHKRGERVMEVETPKKYFFT